MFVLKSKSYSNDTCWDGYWTGKTYRLQGEVYAVCDTSLARAKKYISKSRAELGKDALENICTNYAFTVVDEGEE